MVAKNPTDDISDRIDVRQNILRGHVTALEAEGEESVDQEMFDLTRRPGAGPVQPRIEAAPENRAPASGLARRGGQGERAEIACCCEFLRGVYTRFKELLRLAVREAATARDNSRQIGRDEDSSSHAPALRHVQAI